MRVTQFIAPYTSLIPPNDSYNVASVIVPADDETTSFYFIAWGGKACPSTGDWRRFNRARGERGMISTRTIPSPLWGEDVRP